MNVAIITGASSGLGIEYLKQVSTKYSDLDEIWLVARRLDRLTELANGIAGVKCVPVALDLAKDESYIELDNRLKSSDASVRLLINNAGFGKLADVIDADVSSQTSMVDLNCKGLTGVAAVCLKHMKAGSAILNVASIASFAPNTRLTVYSSTKAYVLSFTKGLHQELKDRGIKCMCVCPGPMKTEFLEVANIAKGSSKTFDTLPYCDASEVAEKSLTALEKGRCVYTNKLFYKFYRLVAKLLPHSIVMKMSKA